MDDTRAQSGDLKAAEISPDLLKNTPSNIARLTDVIEHCVGRQKYLAQTRSPSDGSDVRWYFCKTPLAENELAASVLSTEIVGKSEYFRFGMRDSLAIEASFLEREEELLSLWWKEYAECSEGPRVQVNSVKNTDARSNSSSVDCSGSTQVHEVEEERVGVPVKGGLYEVDLVRRHCFPVYWNGDNRRVLRGHWFARKGGLDWLPIREDVAEQLEVAYRNKVWRRRSFQPSGLFAARVDVQGSSPGLHALFTGENDTWEAWLNVDPSGFSSVVGFSGNGIKLRRGYSGSHSPKPTQEEQRQRKEEEMDDYCSEVPVQHLVFMVHGIGQRLEKSNLVDDVGNFRRITASLAERNLTSHQRGTQRVLFIPCQWRKGLKLSGEAAVDRCTLDGVRGLRVMLSATVHDVLYYMSPIYCQTIIDSVSNQLNCLYLKFIKRNPGYNGKVSIYGHSLGSVLSYDILCHQENLTSPFPMDYIYNQFSSTEPSDLETNTNPSTCQSSEKMDPKNSIMSETAEMSSQNDESMINAESHVLEHGEALGEDFSSVEDTAATDIDLIKAKTVDPEPTSSFDDGHDVAESNDHHPAGGSSSGSKNLDVEDHCAVDSSSGSKNLDVEGHCAVDSSSGSKNLNVEDHCAVDSSRGSKSLDVEEYGDRSDKDATIGLLTEEICSLKAQIAELESQRARTDADDRLLLEKAELPLVPEEPITENLSTEDRGAPKSYTPYVKYTKLEFKVDTFFAVGSPLGVFLALRNIRLGIGKGKDYWDEENITEEMPACRQMFNIFHPFDPVAYRVEPLVCKEYMTKRPVIVPYHKGGRRLHIGFQEFTEDLASRSHAIADHFHSVRVRVLTVCQSRNADKLEDGTESEEGKEERSYGSIMMERLTGSNHGRIDHVLQDKTFEHPYLQTLGAHTNYWRDYDTALFILKHLYRDIPEDPNLVTSGRGSPDSLSSSQSQTDEIQTAEEELPLTFSDKQTVKSFSAKANKYLKKS